MSFVARRFLSTSSWRAGQSLLRYTVMYPAPANSQPLLETAELQQLAVKARGPWSELGKEETIKLYRASFPVSFKEMVQGNSRADNLKVTAGVLIGMTIAYFLGNFLRDTVGPTKPHTFNNKQWEADTRERLLKQNSNPIAGISSKR